MAEFTKLTQIYNSMMSIPEIMLYEQSHKVIKNICQAAGSMRNGGRFVLENTKKLHDLYSFISFIITIKK